ncbi:hypothetical protein LVB87_08730 [Lysobacter sp. KIS68-7]|uniref:hypothetical protein n=1 Tax=Lysobacter sp. KIS68-7 TaxID=2904252 RepID=UPI001E42588F|nr:hypothetical protein [Lysobacter sp. KIS68-7]UHQ18311.1 hypothetical protein LVB87_08730 [Lysobacter sp. KIS68-7]
MKDLRHPIPKWVTSGKTIRQLIEELQTFENQDMPVRMSLDDGATHHGISLVMKRVNALCLLINSEHYYENGWQDSMDGQLPDA